jgi:tRNA nucleotidyltransferase (CCA-adding enzyme)
MRWISPGHEAAGAPLADSFLARIGSPLEIRDHIRPLVVNHLAHHQGGTATFSDAAVRRLAKRMSPAAIDQLCIVMRADHDGRPPLHSPETLARIDELRARAQSLVLAREAPKPLLLGRHLLQQGLKPGPDFKPLLDQAFEAQLDGAFFDDTGAVEWLKKQLQTRTRDVG